MADIAADLGPGDVHKPSAGDGAPKKTHGFVAGEELRSLGMEVKVPDEATENISADKRKSLDDSKFALPAQKKYPIDTAARTRNAAARLEQMKKRGKISAADYGKAKTRIAKAAKRFGIESQYNASADGGGSVPTPAARNIHVRVDGLAAGGAIHVRHDLKDGAVRVFLPAIGLSGD